MPLEVGIHEDVIINKVTKNDKGQLVIGVKKSQKIDPLAALNGTGSTSFKQEERDFIPYDLKTENFGEVNTVEKSLNQIANYKDPLDHIASAFLTVDKRKWDILAGTGITADNAADKFTDQTTLTKIQNNINDQFISMVRGFVGENSKKLRILLIRSSKNKHYPTFRKMFLDNNPFIESMEIPKASSKLRFTDYEIKNGLNLGDQVQAPAIASTTDAATADALFANN